jgi:hypothetical protein
MSEMYGPTADGDIWVDFENDDEGRAAGRALTAAGFFAHYGQTGNGGRPWLLILHNGPKDADCPCPIAAFREHTREEWNTLTRAVATYNGRIWIPAGAGVNSADDEGQPHGRLQRRAHGM